VLISDPTLLLQLLLLRDNDVIILSDSAYVKFVRFDPANV